MKNTRAILAILMTLIAGLLVLLRPEHIERGIYILTLVWTNYMSGKMEWNKPGGGGTS